MFTQKTIAVFIIAFSLAVVFSAPFTNDQTGSIVDAVAGAFGPGGGDGGDGAGGADGGGAGGDGPGGGNGGNGPGGSEGGCCGGDIGGGRNDEPGRDDPGVVPAPSCVLKVNNKNQLTITQGDTVTYTLTSKNAVSANLTGKGAININGQPLVTKITTAGQGRQISARVFNASGQSAICSVTLNVNEKPAPDPAPVCTAKFIPTSVQVNTPATLQINGSNLASASVNNGVGAVTVAPNNAGSKSVTQTTVGKKTYTVTVTNNQGLTGSCTADLTTTPVPVVVPNQTCTLSPATQEVTVGETAKLTWRSTNADSVTVKRNGGSISTSKNETNFAQTLGVGTFNYELTAVKAGKTDVKCNATIVVKPAVVGGLSCAANLTTFTAAPSNLPAGGGNTTLVWAATGVDSIEIDNGVLANTTTLSGNDTVSVAQTITYKLKLIKAGTTPVECPLTVTVAPAITPLTCAANVTFTGNGSAGTVNLPSSGGDVALAWTVTGADSIEINNGVLANTATLIGDNTQTGITADKTFTLKAFKAGTTPIECPLLVDVATGGGGSSDPVCQFDVTPTNFTNGTGGSVSLNWSSTNADSVTLDGVEVALNDTITKNVTTLGNTTFTIVATKGSKTDTCTKTVTVSNPGTSNLSCDSFTSNRDEVGTGNNYTLSWNTTGATLVTINQGVGIVAADDSVELTAPNDEQTIDYTLTATDGTNSVTCPLSIRVDGGGGGGGGGSSSPRCTFTASDRSIRSGQEIELTWTTRSGRDLSIFEGSVRNGEKLLETDDDDTVDEGSLKVRPTEDTTYTLLVERGSRDRECDVEIKVEDNVVVTSVRNQGQVAGISLTSVPYTGFEAGPMLTLLFYAILAVWALFIAYLLVIKEDRVLGISLAGAFPKKKILTDDVSTIATDVHTETSEAAAYVASMTAQTTATVPLATAAPVTSAPAIPTNLPIASPIIGYANTPVDDTLEAIDAEDEASQEMKELEDRAHANKVLLSSDAMRHFLTMCPKEINRLTFLDQVIAEAKVSYPSEDGWVVLNLERMHELCDKRMAYMNTGTESVMVAEDKKVMSATDTVTVPEGSGSLAEAIVTGNIAAAYQLLGNRPMISLADAAADLDALYRTRKGEDVSISNMLATESADLSVAQIEAAIAALTSAIDGTYTDEAAAVKMAIMKAVKATA